MGPVCNTNQCKACRKQVERDPVNDLQRKRHSILTIDLGIGMIFLTFVHRLWPLNSTLWLCSPVLTWPLLEYLIFMTMAYSKRAMATNMVQVSSHRSMREKVPETGDFSLADADMLMSMRSVVMRRDILPGTSSDGIKKLEENPNYQLLPDILSLSRKWLCLLPYPRCNYK